MGVHRGQVCFSCSMPENEALRSSSEAEPLEVYNDHKELSSKRWHLKSLSRFGIAPCRSLVLRLLKLWSKSAWKSSRDSPETSQRCRTWPPLSSWFIQ